MNAVRQIVILGSTGSIGVNTLKVIAGNPDRFRLFALSANTRVELLLAQCLEFKPRFAVMHDPAAAAELSARIRQAGIDTTVLHGMDNLEMIAAHDEVDCVMAAIVGGVGLLPSLAAAKAGKRILLANKEALVMAGPLFMRTVRESGAILLPIDSEHNAIFQCLPMDERAQLDKSERLGFEKIVLTGSGGPFLNTPVTALAGVTPDEACAHPNWDMGRKISVDSATMVNKALELIEACYLFDLPESRIGIMIHPQSIVHSMVHYRDGSVLAQLGNPDMRTPIAHGLAWPERMPSGVDSLDLAAVARLDFEAPDKDRFPCLDLGREAARAGGSAPAILNAANEVAVTAFLAREISFVQIPAIIDAVLQAQSVTAAGSLEEILAVDEKARNLASRQVRKTT